MRTAPCLPPTLGLASMLLLVTPCVAQSNNQTETLSPMIAGGTPFALTIEPVEWSGDPLPAIHSAATARDGDRLLFVGGKTSGVHGFTCDPAENFPAAEFSREIFVIDLATGDVYARRVDDAASGLTVAQQAEMASINTLRQQVDDALLVAGGYGLDPAGEYVTFGTLRVIDVPGVIEWTMGGRGTLAGRVRFVEAPSAMPDLFTLTGGELLRRSTDAGSDEFLLCLGHSYQQGYGCMPGSPGQTYSRGVRRFSIDLNASPPTVTHLGTTPHASWARRRDLNILPARVAGGMGAIVAAGPFTPGPSPGIWTVPITVAPDGTMSMDDPNDPTTLRQGFATYTSASLPMWSASRNENWLVSLGGIGFQVVSDDRYVRSSSLPYSNAGFALRHAPGSDDWSQHLLLEASFPETESPSSGLVWYHGTETHTFPSATLDEHDMYDLDALLAIGKPVEVAILHGGIVAEGQGIGSSPNTYASNAMFRVTIEPASCPADFDASGRVDGADLATLLANWGAVPWYRIEPADLNGDAVVGSADLGILLAQWGDCHH